MPRPQVFEECGLLDVGLVPQAPHNLRQHAQGSGWVGVGISMGFASPRISW